MRYLAIFTLIIICGCRGRTTTPVSGGITSHNSRYIVSLLDTVVFNKKVSVYYTLDSSFKDVMANSTQYPLTVSVDGIIDSFYEFVYDTTIHIDSEEYAYVKRETPNFYKSLQPLEVIDAGKHHSSLYQVIDSSLFISTQCGATTFYLLRVNLGNSKAIIDSTILVTAGGHFIIVPNDNVVGASIAGGSHWAQTLLFKFTGHNYYKGRHMDFAAFYDKDFSKFVERYDRKDLLHATKLTQDDLRNRYGKYVYYAFNTYEPEGDDVRTGD